MEVDELKLVQQSVAGDEAAYRLLLEKHLPSLSRYIARMLGNVTEVDDIIQEASLRLWTKGKQFDPKKTKLTTWLHNIAHNLCIDHFRKHHRVVTKPADEVEALMRMESYGPESDSIHAGLKLDIASAMMEIPERQRSAIIMCHYQGLSNKDAAAILGVSVDALESMMARGRKKLRILLAVNNEH